jgi:mono/diheme cytochrome c family protein
MRLMRRVTCTAIACAALACGDSSKSSAPAPAPVAPTPPPAAQPAPPPPPAAELPPAAGATAGEATDEAANDPVQRGKMHYVLLCATCHGEDGCTPGPGAAGLNPQPAKHCDGNYMNKLTDEHIFKVIKEGGASVGKSPLMAAWGGTLSDDEIRDVMAYVRSLAKPPYQG